MSNLFKNNMYSNVRNKKYGDKSKRNILLSNKSTSKIISAKVETLSDCNLDKYLLPQEIPLPVDLLKREELLLPYKLYAKKENKERFSKHQGISIYKRYKTRNIKLDTRPYVDNSDINRVLAVTDIDQKYFENMNGRQLRQYIPLYKTLKNMLNARLRTRQEIGYKNDYILNIDTNFREERKTYNLSLQRFTDQAKLFDSFIMEDYQKSMKLLEECQKLNVKLDIKMSELKNLADEKFNIMSRLIGLDYKYGLQQKYGRFLYYLSPPTWRLSNREFARSVEIETKGFDFGSSNVEDTFNVMFEKMRRECFSGLVKPVLYFTHPHDLIDVFNGMEMQQLYHFRRVTLMTPYAKSLKDRIHMLKQKVAQDSAFVASSIKGFQNLLLFCEKRSNQLKEIFFKILNGYFFENVGSLEVLKLILHIEFCFEKVFTEKPLNMDMVTMAKSMERMYMNYSKYLDAIHSGTVRQAMIKCVKLEHRKYNRAKHATKELRMFHRLEQELFRAHHILPKKPNELNKTPNVKKLKVKRHLSKPCVTKVSRPSLTEAEIEYLTLFTDWTKNDNPAMYLQSLAIDQDNKK